jgi:hypothetical protein
VRAKKDGQGLVEGHVGVAKLLVLDRLFGRDDLAERARTADAAPRHDQERAVIGQGVSSYGWGG